MYQCIRHSNTANCLTSKRTQVHSIDRFFWIFVISIQYMLKLYSSRHFIYIYHYTRGNNTRRRPLKVLFVFVFIFILLFMFFVLVSPSVNINIAVVDCFFYICIKKKSALGKLRLWIYSIWYSLLHYLCQRVSVPGCSSGISMAC